MIRRNLDWKTDLSKEVISSAYSKWGDHLGVAFTSRKDSTVLMHLIKTTLSNTPSAMFIDHGYHFEETLKNVRKVSKLWGVNLIVVKDDKIIKGKDKKLIRERIDSFKIEAIKNTIHSNKWKGLFTAIRWDEQEARSKEVYFSEREDHFRIHPLLHFTEEDIWEYIHYHSLPYNPLYDIGYRSIGEKGFTKKVSLWNNEERAGRDQSKEKVMARLRKLGYF